MEHVIQRLQATSENFSSGFLTIKLRQTLTNVTLFAALIKKANLSVKNEEIAKKIYV